MHSICTTHLCDSIILIKIKIVIIIIIIIIIIIKGACGSIVVKALCYKPDGRGFYIR
jgi:hypothetical protein